MNLGYPSKEVLKVVGITYRQLEYWDKTNLVKPSITTATGTGSRRIYSFADLVCLKVTARLKKDHISLQRIRKSIAYLLKNFPDQTKPLIDFVFLTDGDSIFVLTKDPTKVLDTLHEGQFVLSVPIGNLVEDTKKQILKLEQQEESEGHVFEVVIEPDKDVYLARCPSLPGCITWGHTEAEAFQYIKDAVKGHLEDMIEDGEAIPGVGVVKDIKDINPVIRVGVIDEKPHFREPSAF